MKRQVMLAAAVGMAWVLPAIAQSGAGSPDTLSALLVEVRALRVAVEGVASATPQVQLLGARLTVQNERVSRAMRDADAVRQELAQIQQQTTSMTAAVAETEEMLTRETDPLRQRQLKEQQRAVKDQLESRPGEEARLRAREAELANALAVEQAQWVEINRRLDALERDLAARRPR